MKKRYHILITIIISVTVFVFCPLIYLTPAFDYNLFIEKNINAEFKEQIKKDNLILNKKENEIRIMTYNLLAHYDSWGGKPVLTRKDDFFTLRDGYLPDVLGLQEMCSDWYSEINKNKSSYKFVTPLKTAFPQKMTAILYNSDTIEVIDSGNRSFSNNINFKARRIVWAVFKSKATNDVFLVINTHFSFLKPSQKSDNYTTQTCQVNELYNTLQNLYYQYPYPIFVIGDFNTKKQSSYKTSIINTGSYGILNSFLTDAEKDAKNKYSGENFSFKNTLNDHIFIYGDIRVRNLALLSQDYFSKISDHYPLLADFSL